MSGKCCQMHWRFACSLREKKIGAGIFMLLFVSHWLRTEWENIWMLKIMQREYKYIQHLYNAFSRVLYVSFPQLNINITLLLVMLH